MPMVRILAGVGEMRSPYERRAQTELESENYFVEWKMRRPRIMRKGKYTQDFFNRFDLLAYKLGESLRWISIKGRAGVPSKHLKEIKEFILPTNNIKEIWARSKSRKKEQ